jgi:hypothetical protein
MKPDRLQPGTKAPRNQCQFSCWCVKRKLSESREFRCKRPCAPSSASRSQK